MKTVHILLVEDDPDDIELMQEAFHDSRIPFTMESVIQGDKVMPYLETCKRFPDVILLDLNLPKMHGHEVLKHLKTTDRVRNIPVVILSTSSAREDIEYCLKTGAEKFLTKPSTVAEFNDTIVTIVSLVASNTH